ncbi:hypothetical protein AB0K43_22270 [Kitasatospora sp. NPDC049258]|uniref:hypothetical protein n=1 Tax=Kitasatospora sp. NPDC049258 TaxID=3155394 RepID=UPI00342E1012
MSGTSFYIDLDEVEAAAKAIRTMLDDLEGPTARLEAVLKQIKPTVYGTDAVGKSLTGGGSSVGGVPEHQQQVFEGVKKYLANSAQLASNLELICQRYRQTDDAHAAELGRLNGARAEGDPVAAAHVTQVTPRVPQKDPITLTSTPTQDGPAYHNPDAPELDYNEREAVSDEEPHAPAGGGRNMLI